MANWDGPLAILEAGTRQDLATAMAQSLMRLTNARAAYCALVRAPRDEHGDALEVLGVEGAQVSAVGALLGEGAEQHALGGGAARFVPRGLAGAPATSAVLVPIGAHGVVVALVDRAPDGATLEQATFLGAAAGAALRHLRAHDETRGLNRRLQALLELQRALSSGILEDAFSTFVARLGAEVSFDLAWIGSIFAPVGRPGDNEVELIAVDGTPATLDLPRAGSVLSMSQTPLGVALRSARARAGGPTFLSEPDAAALAPGARSGAIVPLAMHDALIGVLVILSRAPSLARSSLLPDAAWLLSAIAEPLAMALQNAALVSRLRSAMRDWQATFDVMDAMVLVADDAGNVRRANWALARRLGTTPSALLRRHTTTLFPGQSLPSVQAPRSSLVGPRGEPLRASAVGMPGGGTVIVLHDARSTASSSATMPALRRLSTGSQAVRGRVLIVDDEPSILRAVSRTLGRTHDVVTATDGDEALDLIRRDALGFDAVMTDVQMQRMSGVDLYRAIEREIPAIADRVLFMTGGVFASEVEAFLRGLKDRVLRKPFDPDLLRRTVDERVALSRVA